jgi:hypothetical protein
VRTLEVATSRLSHRTARARGRGGVLVAVTFDGLRRSRSWASGVPRPCDWVDVADPAGVSGALRRFFAGDLDALAPCPVRSTARTSSAAPGRPPPHSLREDLELPPARQELGDPRRRAPWARPTAEPGAGRRPLPPGHRLGREPHRLRRRAGAQALVAAARRRACNLCSRLGGSRPDCAARCPNDRPPPRDPRRAFRLRPRPDPPPRSTRSSAPSPAASAAGPRRALRHQRRGSPAVGARRERRRNAHPGAGAAAVDARWCSPWPASTRGDRRQGRRFQLLRELLEGRPSRRPRQLTFVFVPSSTSTGTSTPRRTTGPTRTAPLPGLAQPTPGT